MSRKSERELTFKLLFMSQFYEKKELSDELLLYFDAPFPFEDKENVSPDEETHSLKESVDDETRQRIVAKYVDILDKLDEIDKKIEEVFIKGKESAKNTDSDKDKDSKESDKKDKKKKKEPKGWSIDRIGKVELSIIRLAVYEILYDDTIPTAVSINEAVEMAKKFGPQDSHAFVNGILARFA